MDVVKTKKNKKTRIWRWSIAAVVALTSIAALSQLDLGVYSLEKHSLIRAQVQQGEFEIKVAGPGILVPQDIRWVASNVLGKVEKLMVKPGALVKQGQLLAVLSNPELGQNLTALKWEIEQKQAEIRAFKVNQDTQQLDMQAEVLATQLEYEKAEMRLKAESKLIEQGNATVSMLDYESNKLSVHQLDQTLSLARQRQKQLTLNMQAQLDAQTAALNRLKNQYQQAQFQFDSLQVKASITGIVQAVPLELGQRVSVGSNLAKLAEQDDLIAELKIPELNASDIKVGQKALIDTRFNQIEGVVSRIDPAVVDGSVLIDVQLTSQLPDEARPDLTINGEILVSEKSNTLYVRRPSFSQANRTMNIFKLDQAMSRAEKIQVKYGSASSTEIEIVEGLSPGEWIIVSDQTDYEHHSLIAIN